MDTGSRGRERWKFSGLEHRRKERCGDDAKQKGDQHCWVETRILGFGLVHDTGLDYRTNVRDTPSVPVPAALVAGRNGKIEAMRLLWW